MANGFITRKAGEGISLGTELFPTITVTYPAGAICSCSNGQYEFVAIDTSGQATFVIGNEYGDWTVEATNGSQTTSVTVTISYATQHETVLLRFRNYIFTQNVGPTNIWQGLAGGYVSTGISTNKMYINGGTSVYWHTSGAIITRNPIDITEYRTVGFDLYTTATNKPWAGIALKKFERGSESSTISTANSTAYSSMPSQPGRYEITVDISNYTGNHYIFFAQNGMEIQTEAYNIWLGY